MTNYEMTCSCGDKMNVESSTRQEAVSKLQAMMTPSAIDAHFKEKHPGQQAIPVAQLHAAIEKTVVAV